MATPISKEHCCRNEIVKINKRETDDKVNKVLEQVARMYNNECLKKQKWRGKIQSQRWLQPARFGSAEDNETPQPKSSKTGDKQELHKQIQKQGTLTIARSRQMMKETERLC